MIVAAIQGGIGNQMFQYALGRHLSLRHRTPLKLDISAYRRDRLRTYALDGFNIHAPIARPSESFCFWRSGRIMYQLYQLTQQFRPHYLRRCVWEQRQFEFDPAIFRTSSRAFLFGHWQNERYFKEIADIIRQDFIIRAQPDERNARLLELINGSQAVSVHIRRGDYVTNPKTHLYHGLCPLEYFQSGVNFFGNRFSAPHFFVFSDAPDWARENFRPAFPTTIIDHNQGREHEDLRLMSACRGHIIANSSFSWWGAWLANHPQKTVVAPRRWVLVPTVDTSDVTPEDWYRL